MSDKALSPSRPQGLSPRGPSPQGLSSGAGLALGVAFVMAFVALVWALRPFMVDVVFPPDQGGGWYLWQRPEATFWSRATGWTGYTLHQIFLWTVIYLAQTRKLTYSRLLHPLNVAALAGNAAFVVLHLVQTTFWYDGLAQDVSIWSSQWAVIFLLVMVLLMENKRRGLAFGKKAGLLYGPGEVVRKYHGYYFAWAVVYTFWYHPMEATPGHLLGTLYTLLIMLQGSLFFTRIHVNRYWTIWSEVMVVFHAAMIAVMNADGSWPIFAFGFAGVFVITQVHGLGLRPWLRWGFVAAYAAAAVAAYLFVQTWSPVYAILGIPATELTLVFIVALAVWLAMAAGSRLFRRAAPA